MDDYPFDVHSQPGTPVDWYLERMKLSGITVEVARKCGFKFSIDDYGAFFRIPYYTIDGEPTTHYRYRRRDPAIVREADVSTGGQHKGKYWQPNKKQRFIYWPPIYNQRVLYNDPSVPLLICERELKSVRAQMAIAANGVPVLVCGLPGTELNKTLADQLREINCIGSVKGDAVHRTIYVALDWNNRGPAHERSEEGFYQLTKLFEPLGAKVVKLRWKLEEDMKGEQKLDDWLQAGGDLVKAMDESLGEHERLDTELGRIQKELISRYARLDNNYIPLRDLTKCYSPAEFNGIEEFYTYKPTRRKQDNMSPSHICGLLPESERNTVYGRAFVPAPLGLPTERYVYEDGARLLNMAPPGIIVPDLPFDVPLDKWFELIQRLCPEPGSYEWYLNFLAHAAQKPMERGHHIVVFQDDGGTGKSIQFQTLDRVYGPLCGPVGAAITSKFNSPLEGKLIGHVSEVIVERREDRGVIYRLKSISGDDRLPIERKGQEPYFPRNIIRLMLATNMDFVAPVEEDERRWAIFGGDTPWDLDSVHKFTHWRDAEGGVAAIQHFLIDRDLSQFDIFAPCPVTQRRLAMQEASAPNFVQWLQGGVFLKKDLWSPEEIQNAFVFLCKEKNLSIPLPTPNALGRMLKRAGFVQRNVGGQIRLWAIRDCRYWDTQLNPQWLEEHGKYVLPGTKF